MPFRDVDKGVSRVCPLPLVQGLAHPFSRTVALPALAKTRMVTDL